MQKQKTRQRLDEKQQRGLKERREGGLGGLQSGPRGLRAPAGVAGVCLSRNLPARRPPGPSRTRTDISPSAQGESSLKVGLETHQNAQKRLLSPRLLPAPGLLPGWLRRAP